MRRRDTPLTLTVLTSIGIHFLLSLAPTQDPPKIPLFVNLRDAESRLAVGLRLNFNAVDFSDLMLIPGISDTLAERLLRGRPAVVSALRHHPPRERYQALTIIHGIGNATAQKLSQYLDLSQRTARRTTSMFLPLRVGSSSTHDKRMMPVTRSSNSGDRSGHSMKRMTEVSGG